MPARVSPTERIRGQIDALFAEDRDLGEVLEDVARLGARLILQTALEAEVTEFLGRDRYARGDRARTGHRNGYSEVTVKTTAGPVTLERPKLRGTDERFASRMLGKHVTRTNALESHAAGAAFLPALVPRGLPPPLLVITDGGPGLIGAVEQVWAHSLRQRCLIHRARNVAAKVSEADRDQVKADFWAIFDIPDGIEPGDAAVADARRRAERFAAKWQAKYPGAVACVTDDLGALTTF